MTDTAQNFMIVEDDPVFGMVLQRALSRRGFNVHHAPDMATALQLSQHHQFDKAVVDLKLEQESGLTVIAELKQRQPAMEIVMLTGYSSISTAVDAIKLGAINYLSKPANVDEILACFESVAAVATDDQQNISYASVERREWEYIQKVLSENEGNVSATARCLGMHRRTLQRKLQKRPVKQ